jgi:hypothetical protein
VAAYTLLPLMIFFQDVRTSLAHLLTTYFPNTIQPQPPQQQQPSLDNPWTDQGPTQQRLRNLLGPNAVSPGGLDYYISALSSQQCCNKEINKATEKTSLYYKLFTTERQILNTAASIKQPIKHVYD